MDPVTPRRLRTQVQTGQTMLVLAVFMALPVAKPTLWILEIWGNLSLPAWLWPGIFAAVGALLLLTRRSRIGMAGMLVAAVLYWTIAGASYLTIGWNAFAVVSAIAGLHAVWTAIDLKARARAEERRGRD